MANRKSLDCRITGWSMPLIAVRIVEKFAEDTGITYGMAASLLIQNGAKLAGVELSHEDYERIAKERKKNEEKRRQQNEK